MDVTEVKFKNPLLLPNIYTIKQKTKTVLHLKKANTIFKKKKKKSPDSRQAAQTPSCNRY